MEYVILDLFFDLSMPVLVGKIQIFHESYETLYHN